MTLLAVYLELFDCNLPRYRIKMKALHPSCKNLTYKSLEKPYTHGASPATSYSTSHIGSTCEGRRIFQRKEPRGPTLRPRGDPVSFLRIEIKTALSRSSLGWRGVRQPEECCSRNRPVGCPVHGGQARFGDQSPFQRIPHQCRDGVCGTDTTAIIAW